MIEILKISLIAFMIAALIQRKKSMLNWYRKIIKRLPWYIYYPLGGCYLCFTGQVCFWYYLIKYFNEYNLVDHLFFASAGIFAAAIYHKIYY